MPMRPARILLALLFGTLGACNDKTPDGGCGDNAACTAGDVCIAGECVTLCVHDGDCTTGEICEEQTCVAGQRDQPTITGVDGDGSANCMGETGNACVTTGFVVTGTNLEGAAFVLTPNAGSPVNLVEPVPGSGTRAELESLVAIAPGEYVLTATNAAGSADQAVELLRGETGAQGAQGPQGIQGPEGALDQTQVDAMNAAIAAAGTPSVVALTDAATVAVDGATADVFTLTIAGDRTIADPTNLVAGQTYTFLITQDNLGGHVVTWDSAYMMPPMPPDLGVFVPASTGIIVGNMTANGGLAAAFDGNTTQTQTEGAYIGTAAGECGKGWSQPKRIMRVRAYGSSNYGFHNPANGDIKLVVEGSNDGGSWTSLYQSLPIRDRVSLVFDVTASMGLAVDQPYTYHRLRMLSQGADGADRLAELEFFEDPTLLPFMTASYTFVCDGTTLYLVSQRSGA